MGSERDARRVERRRGRGRRGRHDPDRAGERRRGIDPHPGGVLQASSRVQPAAARACRSSNPFGMDDQRIIWTCGPIARTVDDAAAMLDVMAGITVGEPHWAPPPPRPFLELARQVPFAASWRRRLPRCGSNHVETGRRGWAAAVFAGARASSRASDMRWRRDVSIFPRAPSTTSCPSGSRPPPRPPCTTGRSRSRRRGGSARRAWA